MTIGVMQPYFFPYIGYFQCIHACSEFVICDQIQYSKDGWIDRNRLYGNTPEGSVYIRPQIQKPSSSSSNIDLVMINDGAPWRKKLIKTIKHTYKYAAHSQEMIPFIIDLIEHESTSLSSFNNNLIAKICKILSINTKLHFNHPSLTAIEHNLDEIIAQYRSEDDSISRAQVRVIEFCKRIKAESYLNTVAGKQLYLFQSFAKHDLELVLLEPKPPSYQQFDKRPFVPNLSIIDMLMHLGGEGTSQYLDNYKLIRS